MTDRNRDTPPEILRAFAQEANNMAADMEDQAAHLIANAEKKRDEASELRASAKAAIAAAERLEDTP